MGESSSCNICTYRQIAQKQDNLLSIFCLFEQIAAYELTEGNSPLIHLTHTCIYLTFNLKNACIDIHTKHCFNCFMHILNIPSF